MQTRAPGLRPGREFDGAKTADIRAAIVVLSGVFAASLFGILTRPVGDLAAFWPANAILLGLMVRFQGLARPSGWIAAALGYVAADLVTGGTLLSTLLLSAANLFGVGVGFALFSRLDEQYRRLRRPLSVMYLVVITAIAAAAAGVIGAVANPILFGKGAASGWTFWFATELVNFMAILPLVLSFPDITWQGLRKSAFPRHVRLASIWPVLALIGSAAASVLVGGPGAMAFPAPALLWCALTYSLFVTSALTFLFSFWILLAISNGYLPIAVDNDAQHALMSIRIGVMLMALAPITVASVMATRNELLDRLKRLAEHDQLTGLLNRSAFRDKASALVSESTRNARPLAVLMADIDHFKSINDTFGHAAGDTVLAAFARCGSGCLRNSDIFGRLGGEEFAIVLADCTAEEALGIAERIRTLFASERVVLADGRPVAATVSIGCGSSRSSHPGIDHLLLVADNALYAAKAAGRNRVIVAASERQE
ncbi:MULTISPECIES: GGDEF domain-containing protein [unclassified Chelatococcus]|jgi:diguanylate cyclase (GGDEF)-like protein|uniref:GGDEF domain-containing protein n=1 Tax=unclassified Chelatococcus TaxID=2638111 RepID=UPI001BCAA8E4|nr:MULTISPECIES: GGDEF domain-containing protein [unclassified Chelatococcus]CAH1673468.1 Diguanylate cyclase (GGDEF)-like protein [Hyphomicrobiales bacterium]MBS7738819.1 diguanylate cyclase [Chelatococcus sp. HY11]MBX3547280.1 diguanylate cyclase [Chelatococcus sp.]MCO5076650.1 diguanylate cyclase [Chelatococcus sp.]CAH1674277.1 Diguanylate cyclase (GGDEF)-like protein [Hyphomicrobiales bacterium]